MAGIVILAAKNKVRYLLRHQTKLVSYDYCKKERKRKGEDKKKWDSKKKMPVDSAYIIDSSSVGMYD